MATEKEKLLRTAAFIFGLVECLIFAGCTYGWPALVYVLKEDGLFSHLCSGGSPANDSVDTETNTTISYTADIGTNITAVYGTLPPYQEFSQCPAQDDRLNLAFTIANFALEGSTLIVGWIFDKYGLRISRLFGMFLFVIGSLMMAFASVDVPILVFPGLACFGMGGMQLLVTNVQIGNFFDKFQLSVVTIYSAAFDTSSVTLLIIKLLHEKGVRRMHSFIFLAVAYSVVVAISTFVLLPKFKILPRREVRIRNKDKTVMLKQKDDALTNGGRESSENGTKIVSGDSAEVQPLSAGKDGELPVVEEIRLVKPLRQYLFTRFYLVHLMWHGLIQLRFFFYLGALNVWLQIITEKNESQISFLTNIFSIVLMCGIVGGPLEGFLLEVEKKRLKKERPTYFDQVRPAALPQALCTTFCLLLSILVLFPNTEVLYVQFIFLTLCRAFLYGLNAAYIVMAFPLDHFGKLFGILMMINGAMGSLQYALFVWMNTPPRDPTPVNIFLLVITVITYLQPIQLWIGDKFRWCRKIPHEDTPRPAVMD